MNRTLFAAALAITLSVPLAAQEKTPALSHHRAGDPTATIPQPQSNNAPQPPSLCSPCAFYGGDIDVNSLNAAGLSDENTLLILGGSSSYGEVDIPAGVTLVVKGILFNIQADAAFDPMQASYDIRTGVSEGNGGTSLASGTGPIRVQATGRNFLGVNEYTIASEFPPVTLTPGAYWFNLTPTCTNTLDGSCSVFRQFVSNTTSLANGVRAGAQPTHQMFFNSSYFGLSWANWCDLLNVNQCALMSFGLMGGAQ